jgi:hypothetical protein
MIEDRKCSDVPVVIMCIIAPLNVKNKLGIDITSTLVKI